MKKNNKKIKLKPNKMLLVASVGAIMSAILVWQSINWLPKSPILNVANDPVGATSTQVLGASIDREIQVIDQAAKTSPAGDFDETKLTMQNLEF